jgi:uncharacterized protein
VNGLKEKTARLKKIVAGMKSVAVAYSGGVDSTLLLKVCADALGDKCLAVTARSETYPQDELEAARRYARAFGVRHVVIETSELAIAAFADNPPDRCYHCKKELMARLRAVADENGLACVADGTNADDPGDYRPGLKAAEEAGARQPLREAGLTKQDVRDLSRELGIEGWDRPAQACLASRLPYGEKITREALEMVERAESLLHEMGFRQCRVRRHGHVARIELAPEDIPLFIRMDERDNLVEKIKDLGFKFVALDLEGYRTGSMNEELR